MTGLELNLSIRYSQFLSHVLSPISECLSYKAEPALKLVVFINMLLSLVGQLNSFLVTRAGRPRAEGPKTISEI